MEICKNRRRDIATFPLKFNWNIFYLIRWYECINCIEYLHLFASKQLSNSTSSYIGLYTYLYWSVSDELIFFQMWINPKVLILYPLYWHQMKAKSLPFKIWKWFVANADCRWSLDPPSISPNFHTLFGRFRLLSHPKLDEYSLPLRQ